ncbi:unnamed protein product [Ranitomeya imitator]|uniref:Uncharacterized protein n=1 Tax=Ranitomeya imitator TaxID=111125 RepID=A0ABN9LBR0_9NEOB|nr:unnamed protein product [Ranitomeya imitator]
MCGRAPERCRSVPGVLHRSQRVLERFRGKKSTEKSKHKECALCGVPLPDSCTKKLCAPCIQNTVAEESVSTANLKEMIRLEVRESLRSLSQAEGPKHRTPVDSNSSEEEREENIYLSSPFSSSSDEESGRFCLPLDKIDKVLVLELNDETSQHTVDHTQVDLLQEQEGYRWKGHERLHARQDAVRFAPGFQPFALVQCQPPAAVTSLALHSEWKLLAFGTSHGFGVYDFQRKCQVMVKNFPDKNRTFMSEIRMRFYRDFDAFWCTLHASDQLALEGPLSRVKSLKKSLRQSFRRIRRSQVNKRRDGVATKVQEANARLEQEALNEMELAPVQRKIEARSAEDSFTGFVRTLYFADTFIRDSTRHSPSLWAGTNGGTVYAFSLRVPPTERRMEEAVSASQIKEIQLMHRAPVVGILILDGHSVPLPEPLEAAHDLSKSPDMQGSHQLLVISEEQFKVFTLPKVSSKLKLKLTATEGCRVRKAAVCTFGSCRAEDHSENHLTVLTNLGDIQVVSLPHLKSQVRYDCIRKEDVSGIASCVFTKSGQGFYLISPSEMERFSLSTCWLIAPRCKVEPPEPSVNGRFQRGDSTERQNERSRQVTWKWPVFHQQLLWMPSRSDSSTDAHRSRRQVMEHALLNDENMLKEIQSTLEGSRTSYGERNSRQIAVGVRLSNEQRTLLERRNEWGFSTRCMGQRLTVAPSPARCVWYPVGTRGGTRMPHVCHTDVPREHTDTDNSGTGIIWTCETGLRVLASTHQLEAPNQLITCIKVRCLA